MRILLTGQDGQVGWELGRTAAALGEVHAFGRAELDLEDLDRVRKTVREVRPQWIVNAAAYTQVDRAEDDSRTAHRINAEAVGVLGEEAGAIGAAVVHYSTDYVFDGAKGRPYEEGDEPRPLNVYGASKLAGERALAASGAAYYVLRTSWVYGARGNNFLRKVLQLARERDELRVVNDQQGSPTWSRAIAAATATLIASTSTAGQARGQQGIFHLTAGGVTTWHEFAEAALEEWRRCAGAEAGLRATRVTPIASVALRQRATRPAYSVLSNEKLRQAFGIVLPEWREQLRVVVAELWEKHRTGMEESHVAAKAE
jgi:dTDP-4-dehydrorhamnose reductase